MDTNNWIYRIHYPKQWPFVGFYLIERLHSTVKWRFANKLNYHSAMIMMIMVMIDLNFILFLWIYNLILFHSDSISFISLYFYYYFKNKFQFQSLHWTHSNNDDPLELFSFEVFYCNPKVSFFKTPLMVDIVGLGTCQQFDTLTNLVYIQMSGKSTIDVDSIMRPRLALQWCPSYTISYLPLTWLFYIDNQQILKNL